MEDFNKQKMEVPSSFKQTNWRKIAENLISQRNQVRHPPQKKKGPVIFFSEKMEKKSPSISLKFHSRLGHKIVSKLHLDVFCWKLHAWKATLISQGSFFGCRKNGNRMNSEFAFSKSSEDVPRPLSTTWISSQIKSKNHVSSFYFQCVFFDEPCLWKHCHLPFKKNRP